MSGRDFSAAVEEAVEELAVCFFLRRYGAFDSWFRNAALDLTVEKFDHRSRHGHVKG